MADRTQREFVDALDALTTLVQSIVTISDLNLTPGTISPPTVTPGGRMRVSTLSDEAATCWDDDLQFFEPSVWE